MHIIEHITRETEKKEKQCSENIINGKEKRKRNPWNEF